MALFDALDSPHSELILGLVAPLGTESEIVLDELHDSLKSLEYLPLDIRMSSFLREIEHGKELFESPEAKRLTSYMDAGDEVRRMVGDFLRKQDSNAEPDAGGDALAHWAVAEIARLRTAHTGEKKAYIIQSLKHPKEVQTLRRIYGEGFFLIGIYSPQTQRLEHLTRNKGIDIETARKLIARDHDEIEAPEHMAQQTRETFHLSDAFVSIINKEDAQEQIRRITDLLFGRPSLTPTVDEFAMFHAFAAALRSADLSRQVGAVIVNENNDLVAVGANDVPAAGGGLYWPGDDDQRDHVWGVDSNAKRRDQILDDIVGVVKKLQTRLKSQDEQSPSDSNRIVSNDTNEHSESGETKTVMSDSEMRKLLKEGLKAKNSILLDITEFGRPVHAEMEAVLSCTRNGISTRGTTLYCTTFPCHNCAKHIVASGIRKVVYVEPYPKSQAKELHSDSIEIDGDGCGDKVNFLPFVGIGPRRFIDLFSMNLGTGYPLKRKKKNSFDSVEWKRGKAKIRIPMSRNSYLERERVAQDLIAQLFEGGDDENKS